MVHLRLDVYSLTKHAQEIMKELRITYQHATPQSMGDQWWFWNCENVPDELPEYLSELELNPMEVTALALVIREVIWYGFTSSEGGTPEFGIRRS